MEGLSALLSRRRFGPCSYGLKASVVVVSQIDRNCRRENEPLFCNLVLFNEDCLHCIDNPSFSGLI